MHVLSKIEIIPGEILEEIVHFAVGSSFLGPPSTLAAVLRVSKSFYRTFRREDNPNLYARIFSTKFDVGSVVRRLSHEQGPALNFGDELVRRCDGMARLRRNSYTRGGDSDEPDGGIKLDLWMAYLMFLENEGKNSLQLIQYARVDRFSLEFVMPGGRLHDGALSENHGWTVDSELNALGLWLFWLTDHERIKNETATQREEILGSLGYLYMGSFKYASTHGPLTHFNVTSTIVPLSAPANNSVIPITASPFSPPCSYPNYYGHEITLAKPLITPPAFLSSVVRLGFHGGLPPGARTPATRVEALMIGWTGATREDYDKFQSLKSQSIDLGEGTSQRHEHDWLRLVECQSPSRPTGGFKAFTPGMLDGIWDGKWLGVPPNFFRSLMDDAREHKQVEPHIQAPVFQQPMQFRIREHHQRNADGVVPFEDISTDGNGAAALRAWLPDGITTSQNKGQLHICNKNTGTNYTYNTYIPMEAILDEALPPIDSERVRDIILTAETTEEFGEAWGHEHYVGRVREWDGLIVLVRNSGVGRWVFYGYIHGDHNLVGRWREGGRPVDQPGWEGVWSMTKRSE